MKFIASTRNKFCIEVTTITMDELKLFKTKKIEESPFSKSEISSDDALRGIKKITTGTNPKNWNSSEISVEIVE